VSYTAGRVALQQTSFMVFHYLKELGEFHDLYPLPDIIWVIKKRRMSWKGHVARIEKKRGAYGVLVGKSEGKRTLG